MVLPKCICRYKGLVTYGPSLFRQSYNTPLAKCADVTAVTWRQLWDAPFKLWLWIGRHSCLHPSQQYTLNGNCRGSSSLIPKDLLLLKELVEPIDRKHVWNWTSARIDPAGYGNQLIPWGGISDLDCWEHFTQNALMLSVWTSLCLFSLSTHAAVIFIFSAVNRMGWSLHSTKPHWGNFPCYILINNLPEINVQFFGTFLSSLVGHKQMSRSFAEDTISRLDNIRDTNDESSWYLINITFQTLCHLLFCP